MKYPQTTFFPGASQTIAVAVASAQTAAATTDGVRTVRLVSSTDCYVKFGSNPTATSSDMFIPGDYIDRYFDISNTDKVAAIRASVDGTLYVTEMTK